MAFHFQSTDSDGYEEEELAQFEAEWLHQHHSLHEMDPYTTTETESIDQVSSEPHEEYLETETSETYISSFDETDWPFGFVHFLNANLFITKSLKRSRKEVEYVRDALTTINTENGKKTLHDEIVAKILNAAGYWIVADRLCIQPLSELGNNVPFFTFGPLPGKVMRVEYLFTIDVYKAVASFGSNFDPQMPTEDAIEGRLELKDSKDKKLVQHVSLFQHQTNFMSTYSEVLTSEYEFLKRSSKGDTLEFCFKFPIENSTAWLCHEAKMVVHCEGFGPFENLLSDLKL